MPQDFVIKLGGSITHPDGINVDFLKDFYNLITQEIANDKRFVIVSGGGALCRKFNKAARHITEVSDEDIDWLGIHATRLNAHLLRTIFAKEANPTLFKKRGRIEEFGGYRIIIGGGWEPGHSSDFVGVQIAADFKIPQTIIMGKPEYVYDRDNQEFDDAKPFLRLKWEEYLKLIPNEWSPAASTPVDPIAAKLAQKEGIRVIVAGRDLANLKNIIEGKEFKGTTIL